MRQQITLMDERMAEMKDRVNKLEQECNELRPPAVSFTGAVRMPNPNRNVLQTPSSAER